MTTSIPSNDLRPQLHTAIEEILQTTAKQDKVNQTAQPVFSQPVSNLPAKEVSQATHLTSENKADSIASTVLAPSDKKEETAIPAKSSSVPKLESKTSSERSEKLRKISQDNKQLEEIFDNDLWQEAEKDIESPRYLKRIYTSGYTHPDLNRYPDILPRETSRLGKSIPGFYVNANLIEVSKAPERAYILAQGPLPETVAHFWQGVLHAESNVVVSLVMPTETRIEEADTEEESSKEVTVSKCDPYWERAELQTKDGWTIRPEGEKSTIAELKNISEMIVKRSFKASHTEKGERLITHLHYMNWPDHGVANSELFKQLIQTSISLLNGKPLTAHCSAGVGRAGTFVASLEMTLDPEQDPVKLVDLLRKGRNSSVIQEPEQLAMVYAAAADALEKR